MSCSEIYHIHTHTAFHSWHKQQPSNQGDLKCQGGSWENVLHEDGPASDFIFVLWYVTVVGLHFKWYTRIFCVATIMFNILQK
jgi:hypothetical protein